MSHSRASLKIIFSLCSLVSCFYVCPVESQPERRVDLTGGYYGQYSLKSQSEPSGEVLFALNRTNQIRPIDTVQAEFLFLSHEAPQERWRLYGYGWYDGEKLTLYSNETIALRVAHTNHSEWNLTPEQYDFTGSPNRPHTRTLPCSVKMEFETQVKSGIDSNSVSAPRSFQALGDSSPYDIHLKGDVTPLGDCEVNLNITIFADLFPREILFDHSKKYAAVITMANIAQIWLFHRQHEHSSTTARAQRLSIFTIALMAFFDSYLIMRHSVFALQIEELFFSFSLVLITEFILLSFFEMRLMFLVAKAQHPEHFEGGFDEVRQQLGRLYCKFYLVLFLGVALPFFIRLDWLIFLFHCTWIPQIVHLVMSDTKGAFVKGFVPGISALRLVYALYFFGCPSPSFVRTNTDTNWPVLIGLIIFVAVQVAFLMFLDKFGSRSFVPESWLPERYRYNRPLVQDDPEDPPDCAICFCVLSDSDSSVMVTPCDHAFHEHCLVRWMDQQMKCPTCRGELPPA